MTTTAGEFDDLVWRNPAPHAAPPSAPSPSKTVNVTMLGAMCACMGPQGNDPMCPCKMRQAGLEPTPVWTPEKREELKRALEHMLAEEERALKANAELSGGGTPSA